ncbi:MAG: ankyrin repeat domain-containing protein [Pyrinomonadaceae bacterium]|nr:ankyrin repeat domain-containing protein [Pyrinomonadaceae bacterium]
MSTAKAKKNTNATTEALWRIAETDDTNHVESILAEGADINASNAHGMTALMSAASHGQIRMVRVLLKHGADPNRSRNDKFTPLMLAAFFGHEEVVRVLVEHGADTGAATRSGTSAQMWAAAKTFQDVVHYLDKPRTVRRVSKAPAVEPSRSQAQTGGRAPSVSGDGIVNLATPAVAPESSIMKEGRVLPVEPSTLACAVKTPNELLEVQESLQRFAQRPRLMPPFQPSRRMVVCSVTTFLLVVALIAGLTWRRQRSINEMSSQTYPTVGVGGIVVTTTSAADSLGEAKTIAPADAHAVTLAQGNDANDVNNHYRRPENVAGENKSKQPVVTPSVVSSSARRRKLSESDSRRRKPSGEQNRGANFNEPGPIPAGRPEDVRNRELPSVAASPAKPQPAVSRVVTPRNGPAPLTTQLISPSKSSQPKGRTIQWP